MNGRKQTGRRGEHGQIMVLFALMVVLFMGLAAIVIDAGMLRRDSGMLAGAVDAGALAGGEQLPATSVNASAVTASAVTYVNDNYPGLNATSSWVSYRCLVGLTAGGLPDGTQIPDVCNPGSAASGSLNCTTWRCGGGVAAVACDPTVSGNSCNVVAVAGTKTQPYGFGPAIGINSGSTGTILSAACKGACGGPPTGPVDVMLVMDRTGSMSGVDTGNATTAANALVAFYHPANQWLGFGLLGPSKTSGSCVSAPDGTIGTANYPTDLRRWVPVGLSGAGAPNPTYAQITAAIACYTNSGTGTDLADPMAAASYELTHNGRTGVRKGIILETDGQPNAAVGSVSNSQYCLAASNAATAAKAAGIEVFTIGFGLNGSNDAPCPDTAGAWSGKTATNLLASMSGTAAGASVDNGCVPAENADGDHFFCLPKTAGATTDLSSIFKVVAAQLAAGAHLLSLP